MAFETLLEIYIRFLNEITENQFNFVVAQPQVFDIEVFYYYALKLTEGFYINFGNTYD